MLPSLSLAVALALGVGAADSNVIVAKIDGKETRLTLAGATAGSERAAAFAQCLVAGRVLRVSGPRSAATVTLLDDTAVSAHIAEFMQTKTSSDPCALGKAAYQPKAPRPAAVALGPLPVVKAKKAVRQVHVSFSGGQMSPDSLKMPPAPASPSLAPAYRPPTAPPPPSTQPTYAAPLTVKSSAPQPAGIYAPPVAGNVSGLSQAPTQQALPQQGTDPMTERSTETVKTTTYNPPE